MKNSVMFLFLRGFIYMFMIAGLAHLVTLEGYELRTESEYSEYSLTEWLESGLALLSGLLFLIVAKINLVMRPVAAMLTALFLMICIREADYFLDKLVADGAWQVLVTAVLVVIVLYLWKQKTSIMESIRAFSQQPSSGILLSGFLTLFVFSRLIGRARFWEAVMGDGYMRVVKNISEEATELLGYGLLSIAAIEMLLVSLFALREPVFPGDRDDHRE